jgi:hypothetical protein
LSYPFHSATLFGTGFGSSIRSTIAQSAVWYVCPVEYPCAILTSGSSASGVKTRGSLPLGGGVALALFVSPAAARPDEFEPGVGRAGRDLDYPKDDDRLVGVVLERELERLPRRVRAIECNQNGHTRISKSRPKNLPATTALLARYRTRLLVQPTAPDCPTAPVRSAVR